MITYKEAHALFEYDLSTGELLRGGMPVGTPHSLGYLKMKVGGRYYFVHRVVFLYCYERWPIQIDHVDKDKTNNRLENLRECSYSQNNAHRGLMRNNTSGLKGVSQRSGSVKWVAQVGYDIIGRFDTRLEAARAYDAVTIERYGPFAVTNKSLGLL